MLDKRIAKRYAKAFFNDDISKDRLNILVEEMKALAVVIESEKRYSEFFSNPILSRETKFKVIENIIKRLNFSSSTLSFFKLLIKNKRVVILSSLVEELEKFSDLINDRFRVTLKTAYEPSVSELEKISERISTYFGRKAIVIRSIDPDIIGGFILESEGKLIDMSVKGQIKRILSKV